MPSSCHNDSNFLFPPLSYADKSPLSSVSISHLPSPGSLFSSSVCCRKLSNEIHTKQDGRLHAFLLAFSCCLFLHLCLFYLPFSVLLYLAVYCPFHLSFTLSSICLLFFLSMGLLFNDFSFWFLLLSLFVFIHPFYSLVIHCCPFLYYLLFFYIFILAFFTWKYVGYISLYLDKSMCACACACVCTFGRRVCIRFNEMRHIFLLCSLPLALKPSWKMYLPETPFVQTSTNPNSKEKHTHHDAVRTNTRPTNEVIKSSVHFKRSKCFAFRGHMW